MKNFRNKGLLIGLVLVTLLGVSSLVGAQKVTISMSVWGAAWEDFLYTDVIIPQYEKENPNVDVKFYCYENYGEKLPVLFAEGEAPDVMRNNVANIGWHARAGIPAPLDNYIKESEDINLNDFFSSPFECMSYLDSIYMLPAGINLATVLYYNKDLFNKAGVKYPNSDWTLNDLEIAAKKMTGGGQYGFLWAFPQIMFRALNLDLGGSVWDKSKKKCIIDNPIAIKAANMIQKWIFEDGIVPRVGPGQIRTSSYAMFMGGKLAMIAEGGWACPAFKRDAPNLNFARTSIPRANPESRPITHAGGTGWTMNSATKHPEEAWKLLKILVSHEWLLTYWRRTWVEVPARKSVLKDPRFQDIIGIGKKVPGVETEEEFDEEVQPLVDIVKNGWFKQISVPYVNVFNPLFIQAIGKFMGVKRGDPEKALKKLAADVNAGIAKEEW